MLMLAAFPDHSPECLLCCTCTLLV